jgi:Sulfotransferase family
MTSAGTPDDPYLDRLNAAAFRPVFIIGPHRSGTTVLYRELAETGRFNVMTLYHLLNHDRLLHLHLTSGEQDARANLTRLIEGLGLSDRGFDGDPVSPDTPGEYWYVFRRQGRRPILDAANLADFEQFCQKVQTIQEGDRPLLLKNPFDTINFLFIARQFPEARFVFIHRNPLEVINSQMRSIRHILEHKNEYEMLISDRYRQVARSSWKMPVVRLLYSSRLPLLFHLVSRNVARHCDYVLHNAPHVRNRATGITYRALCHDPERTIRGVLASLGLSVPDHGNYRGLIRTRDAALLPEIERRRGALEKRNALYIDTFGV